MTEKTSFLTRFLCWHYGHKYTKTNNCERCGEGR